MDKRKIVKIVAKKNGMSQKDVTMVFDEIFSTMLEGLKEEGHVGVLGFGSFNVKKCAVRHRYVLSTQKVVLYPENKKVIFRFRTCDGIQRHDDRDYLGFIFFL